MATAETDCHRQAAGRAEREARTGFKPGDGICCLRLRRTPLLLVSRLRRTPSLTFDSLAPCARLLFSLSQSLPVSRLRRTQSLPPSVTQARPVPLRGRLRLHATGEVEEKAYTRPARPFGSKKWHRFSTCLPPGGRHGMAAEVSEGPPREERIPPESRCLSF